MTTKRRLSDMRFPADTAPSHAQKPPRTSSNSGVEDSWVGGIRSTTDLEQCQAAINLVRLGAEDVADVLGLTRQVKAWKAIGA